MDASRQTPAATMEPVVVEIHGDGFVRIFGSKNVWPIAMNRPDAKSTAGELLVDDLITEILPLRHRQVYFPGMIRASCLYRKITPAKLADILAHVDLFHALAPGKPRTRSAKQNILTALGGGR